MRQVHSSKATSANFINLALRVARIPNTVYDYVPTREGWEVFRSRGGCTEYVALLPFPEPSGVHNSLPCAAPGFPTCSLPAHGSCGAVIPNYTPCSCGVSTGYPSSVTPYVVPSPAIVRPPVTPAITPSMQVPLPVVEKAKPTILEKTHSNPVKLRVSREVDCELVTKTWFQAKGQPLSFRPDEKCEIVGLEAAEEEEIKQAITPNESESLPMDQNE